MATPITKDSSSIPHTEKDSEALSLVSAASLSKPTNNSGISQSCSVKLDGTNFLIWQTHVLPIIRGHKLEGFLTGSKPCPSQFIVVDGKTTLNPSFEDWVAADQLVFGWILNTMTLEVSSQMTDVSTAAGLWAAAKEVAGAQTKSRVLMLKSDFQRTRKDSMKMKEYLIKMKGFSEQLSVAGCPVPLPDLFIHILAGLDAEYNPIVVQLSKEIDELSWIGFQSSLLTYENRMEQLNQLTKLSVSNNYANYVSSERPPSRN
ncbi:hypothetical protein QN277_017165 [Acacia crassicarpa]|uniref:Retrotransposon Copia-like N-terminal domain-containing protein n=1 Tax=Acacia crassicarpa TaxID=499986 RepID=A0AAE1MRH6_9FABA|nr:hypothetical protein QN277_017165 [Acacia crassicarpa]